MASQQKNIESKEMVVGQILSHKRLLELAGKPKEKEKYVMARLGVSKVVTLDKAAKILGDLDPKFITQMNLAALLFSDWNDPVACSGAIRPPFRSKSATLPDQIGHPYRVGWRRG